MDQQHPSLLAVLPDPFTLKESSTHPASILTLYFCKPMPSAPSSTSAFPQIWVDTCTYTCLNRKSEDSITLDLKKKRKEGGPIRIQGDSSKRAKHARGCCDEKRKRLMRLKRCRLFNSAYLLKRHLGGNPGTFHFFSLLFYPHFPTTWCFHFIYFKCCQRGMCFLFLWWYI